MLTGCSEWETNVARAKLANMYDPPGSSLFALRLAIGCVGISCISFLAGWYWIAVPLGAAGVYCFWESIKAKGTDY